MNKKILITGASGLIGSRLTTMLQQKAHRVAHLSRAAQSGNAEIFLWDVVKKMIDSRAISEADAVIHLAGANVGDKPWTEKRRIEIIESRTKSTSLLYEELKKGNHKVKTFVSASGIGYYGMDDEERLFKEGDEQGKGFLAEVVRQWEQSVDKISELGIRVVKIRIGIVLSERGGALKEMMRPVQWYAGAPLGSGTQPISWIHLDDVCNIFIKSIDDESMQGVYNAVAPNPITNKTLTQRMAAAMNKPIIIPFVPAFVLKLILGEMAALVLKGAKVSSQKIQSTGFEFSFVDIDDALKNLLSKR